LLRAPFPTQPSPHTLSLLNNPAQRRRSKGCGRATGELLPRKPMLRLVPVTRHAHGLHRLIARPSKQIGRRALIHEHANQTRRKRRRQRKRQAKARTKRHHSRTSR
jgi:hypothetical protein